MEETAQYAVKLGKMVGEKNGMYGKSHSEETKSILREKNLKLRHTEETKLTISKKVSGENNPMFGAIGSLNPMFGKRGKEHPAWKENKITDLYTQIRGLPEYIQWRLSVFKRDGFTCKDCGNNKPLEAEHKFPFALLILENKIGTIEQAILCEKLWDTNNGITLCKNCHKNTKTYGTRVSELILLFSK
jgi:hypothetical protein